MSLTDDLFGETDDSQLQAEYLRYKAAIDAVNAEYPAVRDWLSAAYGDAQNAARQTYTDTWNLAENQTNNAIDVLSRVPEMSYWALANGFGLAENRLLGAPGSAINVPQQGYAPVTYQPGAYQPYQLNTAAQATPQPANQQAITQPTTTPQVSAPVESLPVNTPVESIPANTQTVPVSAAPTTSAISLPQTAPGATVPPASVPPSETAVASGTSQDTLSAPYGFGNDGQPLAPYGAFDSGQPVVPNSQTGYIPGIQYGDYYHITEGPGSSALREAGYTPQQVSNIIDGGDYLKNAYDMGDLNAFRTMVKKAIPTSHYSDQELANRIGITPQELSSALGVNYEDNGLYNNSILQFLDPSIRDQKLANLNAPRNTGTTQSPNQFNYAQSSGTVPRDTVAAINASISQWNKTPDNSFARDGAMSMASQYSQSQLAKAGVTIPQAMIDSYNNDPNAAAPTPNTRNTTQATYQEPAAPSNAELLGGYTTPTRDLSNVQMSALQLPDTAAQVATDQTPLSVENIPPATPAASSTVNQSTPPLPGQGVQDLINAYIANPTIDGEMAVANAVRNSPVSAAELSQMTGGQFSVDDAAAWLQNQNITPPQSAVEGEYIPAAQTGEQTAQAGTSQFPWQGPINIGPAAPGTGLAGANSTLNSTLQSANATLGNAGQSAVNAIGGGVTQGRGDLAPYQLSGVGANQQMAALNGLMGGAAQESAINSVLASPEFDFYREQGEQGVLRNAAALGGLGGGNVMKELSRFNQGLASTQYNTHYNRLAGMSGQGLSAAGQMGNFAMTGGLAAGDQIGRTGAMQADNTMRTGQLASGNQYNTGQTLAGYGYGGASQLAGQYPGLATAGANAYNNLGNLTAQLGNNYGQLQSNLYTGLGNAYANNAYNRWNMYSAFPAYPGVQQTPGMLGGLASLASGIGTGLGGYAAYANL